MQLITILLITVASASFGSHVKRAMSRRDRGVLPLDELGIGAALREAWVLARAKG